ncbi:MAG: hypothetical protein HW421_3895 [Ignavibacteria bacterium]|nr:hypothetical protein [Ignavibacteria bacterium]
MENEYRIDFGSVNLKIGDIITFKDEKHKAKVASGDGNPNHNCGTMLQCEDGACSITYYTKRILKYPLEEDEDVWSLWFYEGKSLREIFLERQK